MRKAGKIFLILTLLCAVAVGGFAAYKIGWDKAEEKQPNTEMVQVAEKPMVFSSSIPDGYDSMDEDAIVLSIDEDERTITLRNHDVMKNYTLDYSKATQISDRYGTALSMAQIHPGDVVCVTFLKSQKRLNTLSLCVEDVWNIENTAEYEIDRQLKVMTIGKDAYRMDSDVLLFSGSKLIDWLDIDDADILTVHGIGTKIYSIRVEKGHGYLRLSGDEYFMDGWIEVGSSIICPITKDMLLTVPEGTHQVVVKKDKNHAVKSVTIVRGEETTLDLSDIEIEQIKIGRVLFSVTPKNAAIYVDGNRVDVAAPIELEYGIHQMIAGCDGYETMTRYIRVGEEMAGLDIVLEKKTVSTVSGNDPQNATDETKKEETTVVPSREVGKYRVNITAPEGVELYVDGTYIGLTPIDFAKVSGAHIIQLKKDGYEERSYNIQIDEEEKDISYSFAELVAKTP